MNQNIIDAFNAWRMVLFAIHECENQCRPYTELIWIDGCPQPYSHWLG